MSDRLVFERFGSNFTIPVTLMVVGEAPGYEEAKTGIPFVGKSGKLLDTWLEALSIDKNYVITNIVKEHPIDNNGKNRPPTTEEIEKWNPVLYIEINTYIPKYILALGNTAYKELAENNSASITQAVTFPKILKLNPKYNVESKVLVFWHPSYVMRNNLDVTNQLNKIKSLIT
ncbi:MAG: uracil-DNA glycosylase [Candidatus Parvarchaeota archaeon]